ncbi:MAG TPA: hypothetical protein VGD88_06015 [Opitutaceae bacterium]
MTDAATLQILIDIRDRLDGLNRTEQGLADVNKQAQTLTGTLKAGLGIDLARRGMDLLTNSLRGTVMQAIALADRLDDVSDNLGITAEALQVLVGAGRDAGAEMQTVVQALTQLKKNATEASDGTGALRREFASLGIDAAKLTGLALEDQLEAVARAVSSAADQNRAFNSALAILGTRNAPQLISVLQRLGRDGFAKLSTDIRNSYGVMANDVVARLAEAKEKIEQLQNRATVAVGSMIGDVLAMDPSMIDDLAKAAGTAATGFMNFGRGIGYAAAQLFLGKEAMQAFVEAEGRRLSAQSIVPRSTGGGDVSDPNASGISQLRFRLAEMQKEAALISSDVTLLEGQRREKLIALLHQQANLMDRIREAEYGDVANLDSRSGLTDAQLQRRAEMNKMLIEANALRQEAELNVSGGPSRLFRSRAAVRGINDPLENPGAVGLDQSLSIGSMDWAASLGSQGEQVAGALQNSLGATVSGIGDGIHGWITGTKDWGSAALELGDSVFKQLLDLVVQMGVQWVVTGGLAKATMTGISALGSLLRKKDTAETIAAETAKSGPLLTNAAAASAGSFGLSAIIGLALLASLLAAFGGFQKGGYTGDGAADEPAGIVHRGETVFSQGDVARFGGPDRLEELRVAGPSQLTAAGGGPPLAASGSTVAGLAGRAAKPQQIFFVDSRSLAERLRNDAEFKVVVRDIITSDPGAFGIQS